MVQFACCYFVPSSSSLVKPKRILIQEADLESRKARYVNAVLSHASSVPSLIGKCEGKRGVVGGRNITKVKVEAGTFQGSWLPFPLGGMGFVPEKTSFLASILSRLEMGVRGHGGLCGNFYLIEF